MSLEAFFGPSMTNAVRDSRIRCVHQRSARPTPSFQLNFRPDVDRP